MSIFQDSRLLDFLTNDLNRNISLFKQHLILGDSIDEFMSNYVELRASKVKVNNN